MQWVRSAWLSVSPETIQHCWRHTGITEALLPPPIILDQMHKVVQEQMDNLRLANPIDIQHFLNPIDEDHHHYLLLSNDEFIEASTVIEQISDQDEAETSTPEHTLLLKIQIDAVCWIIKGMEATEKYEEAVQALQAYKKQLEHELGLLAITSSEQLKIINFFTQRL